MNLANTPHFYGAQLQWLMVPNRRYQFEVLYTDYGYTYHGFAGCCYTYTHHGLAMACYGLLHLVREQVFAVSVMRAVLTIELYHLWLAMAIQVLELSGAIHHLENFELWVGNGLEPGDFIEIELNPYGSYQEDAAF